jgi:hypothetical protein
MEIWTFRDTSAHPSKEFFFHRLILLQTIVFIFYYEDLLISCIIQASYFASQGFRRRDERSNMLLVSAHRSTSL